jgi:GDP-L-fucose synthase
MQLNSKIYIAGHRGMVGSAIWRQLEKLGYNNLSLSTGLSVVFRHNETNFIG